MTEAEQSGIRIIRGGGHEDLCLPLVVGAEIHNMFKVIKVDPTGATIMISTTLYDDPKWLGYDTYNHRATAMIRINHNERLNVTYPKGVWTYSGYKNEEDKITLELGKPTAKTTTNIAPDFIEYFGEKDALEVIMHPKEGAGVETETFLYSNFLMTSPDIDYYLYKKMPQDMVDEAGNIIALRYGFDPGTVVLKRGSEIIAKLSRENPTFREGRMEYRFIPNYTVSDDKQVITINMVDKDLKTNKYYLKQTEVIVDDTIIADDDDPFIVWNFRAGRSIIEQTKNNGELAQYFLQRAKQSK